MNRAHRTRWALVLSGGGAKGLIHAGALAQIDELGFPAPALVVGTSIGAIVGGVYACGTEPPEIERFILHDFNMDALMDGSAGPRTTGPLARLLRTGQALGNLVTRNGADSGAAILELLDRLTQGRTFAETRVPFYCNAVDLLSGEEVVFNSGSVALAIRASLAYPGVFEPLARDNRLYVDGGIANNLPIHIARKHGFHRILAIDAAPFRAARAHQLKRALGVLLRSVEIASSRGAGIKPPRKRPSWDRGALTLECDAPVSNFDFSQCAALVGAGRQLILDARERLELFFADDPASALIRHATNCKEGTIHE